MISQRYIVCGGLVIFSLFASQNTGAKPNRIDDWQSFIKEFRIALEKNDRASVLSAMEEDFGIEGNPYLSNTLTTNPEIVKKLDFKMILDILDSGCAVHNRGKFPHAVCPPSNRKDLFKKFQAEIFFKRMPEGWRFISFAGAFEDKCDGTVC